MIPEEIFKINCPCMCLGVFRVSGCEKHLKWLWELPSEVLILPPCTFIVSTQPDHARSHSSPLFLHSEWIQRLGSLSCGSGDSVVIWGLDPEPYICRVYAVPELHAQIFKCAWHSSRVQELIPSTHLRRLTRTSNQLQGI